ncbi:MAG: hypothetical protein VB934_14150 [Polyangiaceae bacterium]
MRHLVGLVMVLGLCACPPVEESDPRPPNLDARRCVGSTDAATETRQLRVGSMTDDAFVAYTEGESVSVIQGFQGGYMITPSIEIERDPGDPGELCLMVRIQNTTASVELAPGIYASILFENDGGVLRSDPIYDLLSFDSDELVGVSLVLDVEVESADFRAAQTVRLTLQ